MTTHALLVCVEHYPEHAGSPGDLPGAPAQTLELVQWLTETGAAEREHITVLASIAAASEPVAERLAELVGEHSVLLGPGGSPGELTSMHFEAAIDRAPVDWRDGDRFLLHWAGHGYRNAGRRRLELPAYHVPGFPQPWQRAIDVDDLLSRFTSVACRIDQFAVFEVCADDRADAQGTVVNVLKEEPVKKSGKARLSAAFAAGEGQFARRMADEAIFTRALIEELRAEGPDALTERRFRIMSETIDTRLVRSVPGGRRLTQSMLYRGPNTTDWRAVERDPDRRFEADGSRLLSALRGARIGADEQKLLRTYLREQGVPPGVFVEEDPVEWATALMALAAPTGEHPIRYLLEWLYVRSEQTWVAEWAERLKGRDIEDFRPADVAERQPLTLVVFIRENDQSPDDPRLVRYDAEPLFYVGADRFALPEGLPSGADLPRDRLVPYLVEFYRAVWAQWTSVAQARLQVVLPTELFNEPFELADAGDGEQVFVLGEHHELVLRPILRHGVARPMHYATWTESLHLRSGPALAHLNRHHCGDRLERCPGEAVGFFQDYRWEHHPDRRGRVEYQLDRGKWALVWTHGTTCTGDCTGTNGANAPCPGADVGNLLHRTLEAEKQTLGGLPSVVMRLRHTLNDDGPSSQRVVLLFDDPGWCPWAGTGRLNSVLVEKGTRHG
ncbi:caspase family protein [Embleya sp. NPDC020886]|uniref:caspase family protein n=1 Tax=Embleya sp. NPDC020886 TaxID=3363980 RepID=UPI0037B691AB